MSKQMKDLVLKTAKSLLKANNTVTTLEVKTELRKQYPHFRWKQNTDQSNGVPGVSELMAELEQEGNFTFTDNGTHRVYSGVVTPAVQATATIRSPRLNKSAKQAISKKTSTISKSKAEELMKNNKGHFFTATFTSKKGLRTINCQYLKDQKGSNLGYVKVKEASLMKALKENGGDLGALPSGSVIRSINLQTLQILKIGGVEYKVN